MANKYEKEIKALQEKIEGFMQINNE